MTQFDYILVSFVCMCITAAVNGRMAYADFSGGERNKGWISLVASALCAAAALFNLTQLVSMQG